MSDKSKVDVVVDELIVPESTEVKEAGVLASIGGVLKLIETTRKAKLPMDVTSRSLAPLHEQLKELVVELGLPVAHSNTLYFVPPVSDTGGVPVMYVIDMTPGILARPAGNAKK